jgi:hypothetical protein
MLYCQLGVDKMSLKLDGWEDHLDDYTKSKLDLPFAWGSNDCWAFSSGAITAMTGHDMSHFIRGKYNTKFGALKQAVKHSCKTLSEFERKTMNDIFQESPLSYKLEYGDVVIAHIATIDPTPSGPPIGIISRNGYMLVPGKDSLVMTNQMEIEVLWKL